MNTKRIVYLTLFAALAVISSSCHPRQVSDIKPNMKKEEVVALWGGTPLVTHKTVDGKAIETWEYHFATTDSICVVTFSQERVVRTECRRQPPSYYYAYPYPYYYPPQPPVVVEREAPVFVAPSPKEENQYWYFCEESNAYYPYVKRCPGGWKKVRPTPESERE